MVAFEDPTSSIRKATEVTPLLKLNRHLINGQTFVLSRELGAHTHQI
jgi:hypothetical protein